MDSGATAVSLPITNETGVLHVSPLSGYSGLTRAADKGEPAKYYPSGKRNFARLVPTGHREATALARWIKALDFNRVVLAYDGLQEGLGQGGELERALQAAQVEVVDVVRIAPGATPADVAGDAQDLAREPAPALVYAGGSSRRPSPCCAPCTRATAAESFFVTSGVAGRPFVAGIGPAERQVRATTPLLPLERRPPAARRMARRYLERFGVRPPPAALYGYEAMRGVLDAIRLAGDDGNDRAARHRRLLPARCHRVGARVPTRIGADGDTSHEGIGAFRVGGGRLRFERLLGGAEG